MFSLPSLSCVLMCVRGSDANSLHVVVSPREAASSSALC